ncbi:MAG: hypothetical protein M3Q69_13140 [Acidobacteriota bacterium]|nr:hypothetical protein [Acidobacteriota bacterium]
MKRILAVLTVAVATAAIAAPPLFKTPTESKWNVTKGGSTAGTITLLTAANGTRAEWRASAKSPVIIFLGSNDKVWVRESGGDVELASYKGGIESSIVPALLFTDAKAKYTRDDKGPSQIEVNGYVAKRTSFATSKADASNFVVRPKKGAASRLARLSGDLLGPSNSTVSATAGGRGVGTKGLKLADGGDYAAVEALENRDAGWAEKMSDALAEFQKDGKVGKGREE